MDDKTIIALYFKRDEAAISETAAKYGRALTGISKNLTGSGADADECVNDTYLAAWNSIPPQYPANFFAYLCRIVRNISYNLFHKATAKKRSADVLSLDSELIEMLPSSDALYLDGELLGRSLDAFIRTLDERTQILFVRRYFYAEPIASLAALSHKSEGGVTQTLMRTRKKLRKYLEIEGFGI